MDNGGPVNLSQAKAVIDRYRGHLGTLIEVLQDIQAAYGYVPQETVDLIADELGYSEVHIYGVLTFYAQFYLTPRGTHALKICQGTACHVMGGKQIFDYLSKRMEVEDGETTRDGMFTLERVACVGACGMAPVMVIDEHTHGDLSIQKATKIISQYSLPKEERKKGEGE